MAYRRLTVIVLGLVTAGLLSCPEKLTGVKGQLVLETGATGDLGSSHVQLFDNENFTGNPIAETTSDPTGSDKTRSDFQLEDVPTGSYTLFAWKDQNSSNTIDHLDLVGFYYQSKYGGYRFAVKDEKVTDVGPIVMSVYRKLALTASGERDENGWIDFSYKFNDDCDVTSWSFSGPWVDQALDSTQIGHKTANTVYHSDDWVYDETTLLPDGIYTITITGRYQSKDFTLADTAEIN
jgi:hypothetical protein